MLRILKFLFLSLSLIVTKLEASLVIKSNSICKIPKNFVLKKCVGNQQFKCTEYYCSTNKTSCENFLKLRSITEIFTKFLYNQKRLEEYSSFVNSVKLCQVKESDRFNLDLNVCVSGHNCFVREKFKLKNKVQSWSKKILCPCEGSHRVSCGKGYCASSENDCELFLKSEEIYVENSSLKECKNIKKFYS